MSNNEESLIADDDENLDGLPTRAGLAARWTPCMMKHAE